MAITLVSDYLKVAIVGINDFGRRTVEELFYGRFPMEQFIFLYVAELDGIGTLVISNTGERTEYSWEQICESIDIVIVVSDFSALMETKIACRLVVSVKSRCGGLCFGFFARRPVDETNLRKAFDAIFFYPEKTAIPMTQWFFSGIRGIAMALGPGLMTGIDFMDMREIFQNFREGYVGIYETVLPAQSSEAAFVHAAEKAIESIPRQPRRWMAVFLGSKKQMSCYKVDEAVRFLERRLISAERFLFAVPWDDALGDMLQCIVYVETDV